MSWREYSKEETESVTESVQAPCEKVEIKSLDLGNERVK